jgi:hypothetical protein
MFTLQSFDKPINVLNTIQIVRYAMLQFICVGRQKALITFFIFLARTHLTINFSSPLIYSGVADSRRKYSPFFLKTRMRSPRSIDVPG